MKTKDSRIFDIVFVGVLAAMVYVVTLFRFPLLGSKVHFANAVCLLSGMLLGPVLGGMAAGIGSALFDAFTGYDFVNVLISPFTCRTLIIFCCLSSLLQFHSHLHQLVNMIKILTIKKGLNSMFPLKKSRELFFHPMTPLNTVEPPLMHSQPV